MNDTIICPECGSRNVAKILWGLPLFRDELEAELDAGRIVLGGCDVSDFDADWRCNVCGCEFGKNPKAHTS